MKLARVDTLTGEEHLAKPVVMGISQMLLYEGTLLKKEYIERLVDLGIEEVYIMDENADDEKLNEILKEELRSTCKLKVKHVLEQHVYKDNVGLSEIGQAAEDIIEGIMEKEEVVEKVYEIKERSADIYDHCVSVCALATLTALKMNLPRKKVYDIGIGSLLHDLGLRYISINYENIPLDSLSPENLFEYKKHTVYGFSSVEKESWMSDVAKKILLFHHERIDGSGFPLKMKNISLENRIVAVCDHFDEMICGIGCERVKVQEAIEFIKMYKNVYFDGKVVDAFLDFVATYPSGTIVKTNEGETAKVVGQNEHFTDRPILCMISDKEGNKYKEKIIINLMEVHHIFIEEVVG
jgi:HD-GYP domain-containing protein (c-di-GMP phosphodiesterase class II)